MASQAAKLKGVVSMYQTLIKEWNRKPLDLEKVGKLLSGMKVSRVRFCLVILNKSILFIPRLISENSWLALPFRQLFS